MTDILVREKETDASEWRLIAASLLVSLIIFFAGVLSGVYETVRDIWRDYVNA